MNRDEAKRGLSYVKDWVDSDVGNQVAEDVLRVIRNIIWDKYGTEELATLETEIDLGL